MIEMTQTGHHVMDPPGELFLSGDIADNWRKWKGHFLLFLETLPEKDDDIRTSTFLQSIGEEALNIFQSFHWDCEEDKGIMSKVLERFDSYCYPHTSLIYERYLFNMRCQKDGESIDNYVAELRNMARTCEFGTQTESLIRDRVICGIHDDKVRSKLLREEDLYLEKAIEICRHGETEAVVERSLSRSQMLLGQQTIARRSFRAYTSMSTDDLFAKIKKAQSIMGSEVVENPADKKLLCHNCDERHKRYEQCPAFGIVCALCKKRNHFAKVCKRQILRKHQFKIPRIPSVIETVQEDG